MHRYKYSSRISLEVKAFLAVCWLFLHGLAFVTASSVGTGTLPRSVHALPRSNHRRRQPLWNPSPHIDADGFLAESYRRLPGEWEEEFRIRTSVSTDLPCYIRQVPGDGNCLFHSISLCLYHAVNGTHLNMQSQQALDHLYQQSKYLRAQAVSCLRSRNRRLVLQGRECVKAHDIVQAAAQQYGISPEAYCEEMEEECVWGGGPEIVALCNLLQRPIHVYELVTCFETDEDDDEYEQFDGEDILQDMDDSFVKRRYQSSNPSFVLRRMACFGSPRFDKRQALHLLSADSRFPDLRPGSQLATGNHFLAVFPVTESRKKARKLLRGGSLLPWRKVEFEEEPEVECIETRGSRFPEWISLSFWQRFLLG